MYLVFYSILLLHVSAIQICHHQVGQWYTKKIKGERPVLKNSEWYVTIK